MCNDKLGWRGGGIFLLSSVEILMVQVVKCMWVYLVYSRLNSLYECFKHEPKSGNYSVPCWD